MKFLHALLATLLLATPALSDDMRLILELVSTSDDTVTGRVALYSNNIDPNRWSVDDAYRLEVDGRVQKINDDFLARLAANRRAYSYDALSGGITEFIPNYSCMMAGPALGDTLRTRYLTYDNDMIVGDEMRDVATEPENCLFLRQLHPADGNAHLAAAQAIAALQTLKALAQ